MTEIFGLNIHAQGVKNWNSLFRFIQASNSTAHLMMDALDRIEGGSQRVGAYASLFPKTMFIHRNYGGYNWDQSGDNNLVDKISPEDFLDREARAVINNNVWHYVGNEQGFGANVITWYTRLLIANAKRSEPLKLVIGNWSAGTPAAIDEWQRAQELMTLASRYRTWCIVGLHEYAGGIATSGFVGGSPVHPAHPDYTKRQNWPENPLSLTLWHVGRFKFLLEACARWKIQPPRLIMTEFGFDFMSDIKDWLDTLPKTDGTTAGGWRTLRDYWRQVFPDWSHEVAAFEQAQYLITRIYAKAGVEAALWYCYGSVDRRWSWFDLEGADEFLALVVREANTPSPVPAPVPVPTPEPPVIDVSATIAELTSTIASLNLARVSINEAQGKLETLSRIISEVRRASQ